MKQSRCLGMPAFFGEARIANESADGDGYRYQDEGYDQDAEPSPLLRNFGHRLPSRFVSC